jgi:hypothetical protein
MIPVWSRGNRVPFRRIVFAAFAIATIGAMPPALASADCPITEFGARAGDDALDTVAIQRAIDACAARGGGRVVVPAGRFVSGTFRLASRIELHLAPGAMLLGSPRIEDYPPVESSRADDHAAPGARTRSNARSGEDDGGTRALIFAGGVEDVSITGTGTIDGNGAAFWGPGFMESGRARPQLPRPRPWIWIRDARRVTVRDLFLTHSPSYFLTFERCDEVFVAGARMFANPRSPNSDGIQIEGSRNVRIVGVDIRTGDDAIVLKASAGDVENVIVTASYLESDDAAFKLGTGSEHAIRRIRFTDSVIARSRFGITLFMKDGGEYADITASGIDIATASRHATEYPIYFDVDRRTPRSPLGTIRDVTLKDLRVRTRGNVLIGGHPQAPIRNLAIDGLEMRIADPVALASLRGKPRGNALVETVPDSVDYSGVNAHLTLAHLEGARIANVKLSGERTALTARQPIHLHDAVRTTIDELGID